MFETTFYDVTDDCSIYALTTQGLERIIAGGGMHSLVKVFDLRVSGSHAYHSASFPSKPPNRKLNAQSGDYTESKIIRDTMDGNNLVSGGWNLFLHPRRHDMRDAQRSIRTDASSVYSLSLPSPTSPFLYAGLEGAVMGIDFLSVMDKHPDPFFAQTVDRFPDSGTIDIKSSYNPFDDVFDLGMYEQGTEQALDMKLIVQEKVGEEVVSNAERRNQAMFQGLDERWKDPSTESDRWERGQQPQGRTEDQSHNRGRGRGRGRGQGRGRGTGRGRGV
jgi:hypothetical protein